MFINWCSAQCQGGCALQDLSVDQVVSLVSCTVWQERAEAGQKVREDMQQPFHALQEAARRIGKVHYCSPDPAFSYRLLERITAMSQ